KKKKTDGSSVHRDVFRSLERSGRGISLHGQTARSARHTDRSIQRIALAVVFFHSVHINLHAADGRTRGRLRGDVHGRTYCRSGIGRADGQRGEGGIKRAQASS